MKIDKENKDVKIEFRLKRSEKELLNKIVKIYGTTISDYFRTLIIQDNKIIDQTS